MSVAFVARTLGNRNVSKEAALPSKKRRFDRVFFEWRALIRSSLPLWIQIPSKTTGILGIWAARLNLFPPVSPLQSMGTRVKGHFCGLPVEPLMPYQQSM